MSLSIRKTIPLLIVTPLVIAIGLIGSFSFVYSRRSVHQLSERLMESSTNRIQDQVTGLLQEALLVNRINASAIESGELDLEKRRDWAKFFSSQLQATTAISYIFFGNPEGYFVGSRVQKGQRFAVMADDMPQGRTYEYEINPQGEISSDVNNTFNYDPRERTWYKAAIAANQPVWSDVYVGFTAKELLITAAHPIYNPDDQLVGVLGIDLFIRNINEFLRGIEVGQTGEIFIVEQSGMLVASSIGDTVTITPESSPDTSTEVSQAEQITRISAFDSPEPLISGTMHQLLDEYGDLSLIQHNMLISQQVNKDNVFMSARPLRDELGLDWLVVVAIPARDFTGALRAQTVTTLIVAGVVLVGAMGLGGLVARWIVTPILRLHEAAVAVKSQQFEPKTINHLTDRDDEIGQFAGVFSEMAEIITEREEGMEEQLKSLRLQAPLFGGRRSLDLSSLQKLQKKAKVIRTFK
ncbi:MAG: cache and HAMP domain-containing protein [Cyanobacteria bacterium P01_F01_bin.150]